MDAVTKLQCVKIFYCAIPFYGKGVMLGILVGLWGGGHGYKC